MWPSLSNVFTKYTLWPYFWKETRQGTRLDLLCFFSLFLSFYLAFWCPNWMKLAQDGFYPLIHLLANGKQKKRRQLMIKRQTLIFLPLLLSSLLSSLSILQPRLPAIFFSFTLSLLSTSRLVSHFVSLIAFIGRIKEKLASVDILFKRRKDRENEK